MSSKTCTKCSVEYPLTSEFWHKNKHSKDGFVSICKICACMKSRKWHHDNKEKANATSRDWYQSHKEEANQYSTEWARNNKDKVRASNSRWQKNHPEKRRAKYQRWADANPDRVRELSRNSRRKARKERPESVKAYQRKWYKENPEKHRVIFHRRRTLKNGNGGSHTAAQLENLRLQQDNCCFHCGVSFDEKKMHVDHWIPISRGGSNNIENIRLLCYSCNCSKRDKLPCEWDDRYCP